MYLFKSLVKTMLMFCAWMALSSCIPETAEEATIEIVPKSTSSLESNHRAETPKLNDKDAEILAMESSGELVAPLSLYERIIDDLISIRNNYPDVSAVNVSATAGYKMSEMLVGLDDEAMARFESGSYSHWDKLNQKFGVVSVTKGAGSYVKMQFERGYNIPQLASAYMEAKMPGMTYAEPNFIMGASQDICLENLADENRLYIFKQGDGDCPAGCISWQYAGFQVDANQAITQLGQFSSFDASPEWYKNNQACKQFL